MFSHNQDLEIIFRLITLFIYIKKCLVNPFFKIIIYNFTSVGKCLSKHRLKGFLGLFFFSKKCLLFSSTWVSYFCGASSMVESHQSVVSADFQSTSVVHTRRFIECQGKRSKQNIGTLNSNIRQWSWSRHRNKCKRLRSGDTFLDYK